MKPNCSICGDPTCYTPKHGLDPDMNACCKYCHDRYCTRCPITAHRMRHRRRMVRKGFFQPAHKAREMWGA